MNILHALLGEHGVFYAQFRFLEEALPEETDLAIIHRLGAMLDAALQSHATLENEGLFTRLEERMGVVPPVMVMRSEHDQIGENMTALTHTRDVDQARDLLLDTIAIARDHFAKEEQVLFPMAANMLPADELQALGAEWAAARGVALGGV